MTKIMLQMVPYGNVHWRTMLAIVNEMMVATHKEEYSMSLSVTEGDSLIEQRRSIAMTEFLQSNYDVLVTVDPDISWQPGDAAKIALKALELEAVVGGLYCKRIVGQGWATRLKRDVGSFKIPSERLLDTVYIGSGFMAIPYTVVNYLAENAVKHGIDQCWNGHKIYFDFYSLIKVPCISGGHEGQMELLSEDWSFCERARRAGYSMYTDLRVVLEHYGERVYHINDALPRR